MVKKKRSPKEREPVGKTKSLTLLYIADKENCTMTDIRRYLRYSLNIINQKVVRRHVADLVSKRLLKIKKQEKRGEPDYYYIESTFSDFRNCFNYLHDNNFSIDFLKTGFAKEVLSRDDFFVFGVVHVLKELFSEVFDILKDEPMLNEIVTGASKIIGEKEVEFLREFTGIAKSIFLKFAPEMKDKTPEELIPFAQETSPEAKKVLHYLIEKLFSQDQKEEIINIVSTSPSALYYLFNLKTENKMLFGNAFFGFVAKLVSQFASDVNFTDIVKGPTDLIYLEKLKKMVTSIVDKANVLNVNPILTILKAHFIQDAVEGKIIVNEYSKKALMNTLIPQVK